jgi:hypothetical protein
MTEKLEPLNLEKVPQRPKVGMRCAHIQAMREDDKTHEVWMTCVRIKGADAYDPEASVGILHCNQCVPTPIDEVEIVWRIPHMIATEEDTRRILRNPSEVGVDAASVEPVSERGMKMMEDEFGKDPKQ